VNDATLPGAATTGTRTRQRAFRLFGAALLLAGLAWTAYWLLLMRHYESTDDAYVSGDVVLVTSEVPGTVTAVRADDTQQVPRGAALVELDPADARVAVASAEAELASTVREVSALFAQERQLRAELAAHELALARTTRDYGRREALIGEGAVSREELAHAGESAEELRAGVASARARLEAVAAQVRGTSVATHPRVLRAAAGLRSAALALRRTRLTASVAGVVAKRNVQIGQRVAPGVPLMAIVALEDLWIDANFKEDELRRIRVGQPVAVRTDLYGREVEYHGTVAGLAAGSGSAFALLPAQNASGNWIKIVQRLPVRIRLDPRELVSHPLRVGLSTTVRVDVADRSGPVVTGTVRATPAPVAAGAGEDPELEARIGSLIASNGGTAAGAGMRPAP
jgi:membrane fusion protein, multidrug efflux system